MRDGIVMMGRRLAVGDKKFRTDVQVMQSAERLLELAEKLAEHYKQILSFIDEELKYSAELFFYIKK